MPLWTKDGLYERLFNAIREELSDVMAWCSRDEGPDIDVAASFAARAALRVLTPVERLADNPSAGGRPLDAIQSALEKGLGPAERIDIPESDR